MQAAIPQQTEVSADEQIATVAFTLNWADDKLHATNEINKAKMDAALKNLTGKLTFTTTAYTGEGGLDISKNGDGSVMAVVDDQDATVYSEGGVLGINTVGGQGMFIEYQASEMDLCGLDTSKMTRMYDMFYRCLNLFSLDVSSFDTSSVTDMGFMFTYCESLSNLDVSSFNTSSVTNIDCMFSYCESLSTLDLSSFDTGSVTNMDSMFNSCNALTTCYGRTQADCNKFNASSNKSANVNFIVKPKN